jgi:hypothetical protein
MPGQAPIVGDERDSLRVFLEYHQSSYLALAFGLSDDQARSTPTVSALSIGGLIKHATGVQRSWMERAEAAPDFPPQDTRPFEEIVATYQDECRDAANLGLGRPGYGGAGAAGCAVVSQGHQQLDRALGDPPPDQRTGPACRPGRHHPRIDRWRNALRIGCRDRGLGGDGVDQALEGWRLIRRAHAC